MTSKSLKTIPLLTRCFFLMLLTFIYTACAFNESRDSINNSEIVNAERKNQALKDSYSPVTGFYQGRLHLENQGRGEDRQVSLGIYISEVRDGTTSTGIPVIKTVLKAVFRQIYPVEAPVILDGNYIPAKRKLTFVASNGTQAGANALSSIDATIVLDSVTKIYGEAKNPTGSLGTLDLTFVQKNVDVPKEGDDEQVSEQLRQQYELITGTYTGTITSGGTEGGTIIGQNEWNVELGIYTLEVPSGSKVNGVTILKPALKAIFKQKSPLAPSLILDAQYIPETGQIFFINPSASTNDLHTINATLSKNILEGLAKRTSGLWGRLHLDFTSKNVVTDPSGEENEFNRKLREHYQKISGTYRGAILRPATNGEPRREWKVELGLYIIDVRYGTGGDTKLKPALKARFKQLSPVAPNVLLDVQYISESDQLLLSVNETGGSPTLPSSDGLSFFTGTIKDNVITGQASKRSGSWGDLNLKLISKDTDSPSFGDQEDYNRRLNEEYETLVGTYKGVIKTPSKEEPPFEIELNIYINQEAGNNGVITPKLKAYYRRTSDEFDATSLTMNVIYKTELTPAGVDMSGQRTIGGVNYSVDLNGTFQNKEYRGVYHDYRGHSGPFTLKLVK